GRAFARPDVEHDLLNTGRLHRIFIAELFDQRGPHHVEIALLEARHVIGIARFLASSRRTLVGFLALPIALLAGRVSVLGLRFGLLGLRVGFLGFGFSLLWIAGAIAFLGLFGFWLFGGSCIRHREPLPTSWRNALYGRLPKS